MKKIITLVISSLLPIFAWSQAQINTKKVKISDFTQKITKVVLSGNAFQDSVLQNGVAMCWRISPYEFCSMEDFNDLKGSEEYYFLLSVNGQFKNDSKPTIHYLTLVKGGKGADEGVGEMLEVVSIPVTSAESPSGRETVFMQLLHKLAVNGIERLFQVALLDTDDNVELARSLVDHADVDVGGGNGGKHACGGSL